MFKEIAAILMLHHGLYAQYHCIPQRDNVQRYSLMDQCSPIKLMIAVHAQLLMLIFDYVIVDLQ